MPVRPTIRDVAALAGVSKSAVSLVLRNQPGVSEATRRKVRGAIKELSYVPDPALARIASHRWKTTQFASNTAIAIIQHVDRPSHLDLRWQGVRAECDQLGYQLETIQWSPEAQFPTLARQLYHRGVRGILLPPLQIGMGFEEADWSSFSLISIGRGAEFFPVHAVAHDAFNSARLCWNRVRALGANLAYHPRYQEKLAEMRGKLERWMEESNDPLCHGDIPCPAEVWTNDPDEINAGPKP